uniref:Uncharacterized protein n=1 Tax=Rhizophora mucronata TaxID=61149 RepID=A0A2P2NW01_RHIMU
MREAYCFQGPLISPSIELLAECVASEQLLCCVQSYC